MIKPVVLLILDGWGYRKKSQGNAIALARTPTWDYVIRRYPWTLLHCKGEWVGLSDGQMGNSEVGHLNIGAGRKVLQPLARIDSMIASGEFYTHKELARFLSSTAEAPRNLHIIGLVSDGGVHSHINHAFAVLDACAKYQVKSIVFHAILDGRDTSPYAGRGFIEELLGKLASYPYTAELGTIMGRYFAMDRDNRWDRTELAYRAIVEAKTALYTRNPVAHLDTCYKDGETDEFIKPVVIAKGEIEGARKGKPEGMHADDAVLFFNFREDRARQLSYALLKRDFSHFPRPFTIKHFFSFSRYSDELTNPTLLESKPLRGTITELLTGQGYKVFKCAETEKYAHVTYFFNGGREEAFDREERTLIPSPKVATYDLKPEMSVFEVAEVAVSAIKSGTFLLHVINFANGDMVGHTGNLSAAIRAAEAVDSAMKKILVAVQEGENAHLLITADHGNFEQMIGDDGKTELTQHSLNPVPFVLISPDANLKKPIKADANASLPDDTEAQSSAGHQSLRDIAPTILTLLKMDIPEHMDGESLLA